MAAWSLDSDVLACGNLRLALQRIGAADWRPGVVLRSWGLAPLHREGTRLLVPCGGDEALWIGAWTEPRNAGGAVSLADRGAVGSLTRIELPAASRITTLGDAEPLARRRGEAERHLELRLTDHDAVAALIELVLLEPLAWTARSGRQAPALSGPPPLPPRLG